jgi:ketosteroid isomerase-like protein
VIAAAGCRTGQATQRPYSVPGSAVAAATREAGAEAPESGTIERYYDALANGAWRQLQAQFWCDANVTTVRPRAPGAAEDVVGVLIGDYASNAARSILRTEPLEIARTEQRLDVVGDVAHAVVRYEAVDRSGDSPQRWRGTDFFTLVRHGDEWRIAALVCSASEPIR